jgi:hypothetical protein
MTRDLRIAEEAGNMLTEVRTVAHAREPWNKSKSSQRARVV